MSGPAGPVPSLTGPGLTGPGSTGPGLMGPGLMGEPGPRGRFGDFGGRYLPEAVEPACAELEAAFTEAWADPAFHARYEAVLADYGGRPTPVTECHRLSERLGVRLLLKREDLAHTGSHKLNNVIGQSLLAVRMGKPRLVAETGELPI